MIAAFPDFERCSEILVHTYYSPMPTSIDKFPRLFLANNFRPLSFEINSQVLSYILLVFWLSSSYLALSCKIGSGHLLIFTVYNYQIRIIVSSAFMHSKIRVCRDIKKEGVRKRKNSEWRLIIRKSSCRT